MIVWVPEEVISNALGIDVFIDENDSTSRVENGKTFYAMSLSEATALMQVITLDEIAENLEPIETTFARAKISVGLSADDLHSLTKGR